MSVDPDAPPSGGPLSGLRVVVTRARDQAASLVSAFEARGATPVEVPVLAVVDPDDGGATLRSALAGLSAGDWLVITSPNGATRAGAAAVGVPLSGGVKIAAIGPGTSARCEAVGLAVDLVPDRSIAEGLAEVFPDPPAGGGRVVLARAAVAREVLPAELAAKGWQVDDVAAYRTVAVEVDDAGRRACATADAVAFTSSSTVTHLVDAVGVDGLPPIVVCIGPATAATATGLGVDVEVVAPVHTVPGLVDALVDHLADEVVVHAEDAASDAAQWCIEQYYREIDDRFETGLDRAAVQSTDVHEISPPRGLVLIARLAGRPVGCGVLKRTGPGVIDIKRMWIDPGVRGRGLGRRLLRQLVHEAGGFEVDEVRLETNRALVEAIALYRAEGFIEVEPFNDEPHAHHWFSRKLP